MFKNLKYLFIFTILINFLITKNLYAQISIIRDAETEKMLREICFPIFKIANQDTNSLKIYIVNDQAINAFVAGGQNIFINTGLITKFSNPAVIAGVIAHEIAHIASGHLAKGSEMMQNNMSATLIGYLAGIGAIISGQTQLGASIMMGSSHIGNRLALKYTRHQEESADILAIQYLTKLHLPTAGFIEIMEYFDQQNLGINQEIDQYELTHPISSSRIKLVKNETKNYKYHNAPFDKKLTTQFHKAQAKLNGFLGDIDSLTDRLANQNDDNSQLTKAILYYRANRTNLAMEILDGLIKKSPNDGFLYELKAEFLFNNNQIIDAIINFKKALNNIEPKSRGLAQINMANAIIQLKNNDDFLVNFAIENLVLAQQYEKDNPLIYKTLASAYKIQGQGGKSLLALAEYNFILDDCDKAQKNANEALKDIQSSCNQKDCFKASIIRANDIIEICKNAKVKESRK